MRARVALATLALGAASTVVTASPAQAWGNEDDCTGHTRAAHTNRWSEPFVGHHIDVSFRMCDTTGTKTVGPHLIWTATPKVTYPSKPGGGAIESVETKVKPFYVSQETKAGSGTVVVRYKWEVKQCALVGHILCQTFDFGAAYYLRGSKICFWGAACDDYKDW